jgi:hypothetical protein
MVELQDLGLFAFWITMNPKRLSEGLKSPLKKSRKYFKAIMAVAVDFLATKGCFPDF